MGIFNDQQKEKMKQARLEAEAHAKEAAQAADQQTDSWLIRIVDSKWSWAILIGMLAAAVLLGVSL